jgi:tRNA A-37 threonylcarbamoyl transferase component Bud32
MKQIIKQSANAVIERDGDRVVKTFIRPRVSLDKRWTLHYEAYYNMFGGVVRVLEADENRIVMDHVEGEPLENIFWKSENRDHAFAYRSFSAIMQNLANMAEYSSMIDNVWYHNDAGTHNYVFDGKKFVLVDPDGFFLTKNPYPGAFVSSLHPLHNILKVLHVVHEKDYNEHVK